MTIETINLKIDGVEDVLSLVECFRWMSWCSVLLRCLRAPPTTPVLRKLADIGRKISDHDDRVIRFVNNIIQRAGESKSKTL